MDVFSTEIMLMIFKYVKINHTIKKQFYDKEKEITIFNNNLLLVNRFYYNYFIKLSPTYYNENHVFINIQDKIFYNIEIKNKKIILKNASLILYIEELGPFATQYNIQSTFKKHNILAHRKSKKNNSILPNKVHNLSCKNETYITKINPETFFFKPGNPFISINNISYFRITQTNLLLLLIFKKILVIHSDNRRNTRGFILLDSNHKESSSIYNNIIKKIKFYLNDDNHVYL